MYAQPADLYLINVGDHMFQLRVSLLKPTALGAEPAKQ